MSTTPTYNKRDLERILSDNGWFIHRINGSHRIYKNDSNQSLTISFNKCNKSKMLVQQIIKDYKLIVR